MCLLDVFVYIFFNVQEKVSDQFDSIKIFAINPIWEIFPWVAISLNNHLYFFEMVLTALSVFLDFLV